MSLDKTSSLLTELNGNSKTETEPVFESIIYMGLINITAAHLT